MANSWAWSRKTTAVCKGSWVLTIIQSVNGVQLCSTQAMADIFAILAVVAQLPSHLGPVLQKAPTTGRQNAYVHPWHLSLAEIAKAGRYPSMHQTRLHFPSVVWKTYQASREALEIKLDQSGGDDLGYFTIRYIDGHNKGIIVQSILAMVIYNVTWPNCLLLLHCVLVLYVY